MKSFIKKKFFFGCFISIVFLGSFIFVKQPLTQTEVSFKNTILSSGDFLSNKIRLSGVPYSNFSVISDGYQGKYWNSGSSTTPSIAVDGVGNIHAVWSDNTPNPAKWGTDGEIMYAKYTLGVGWSNATVISDGYQGKYWNNGISQNPSIAVDGTGDVFVVWEDNTDNNEKWMDDCEIMYTNYSVVTGKWSNVTVISDGYKGIWDWNNGESYCPSIAVDNLGNNIYVVWDDRTPGKWGGGISDAEIMFANWTLAKGWSNATVISDKEYLGNYWNNGESYFPSIDLDGSGYVHVVWQDNSPGKWRYDVNDFEIMYTFWTSFTGWKNASIISDGYNGVWGWNNGSSTLPSIEVDTTGDIYVVWQDKSAGKWKNNENDFEIMYTNYSIIEGKWSNATLISDGYNGVWGWNTAISESSSITADSSGNVYVVWYDDTNGKWGNDIEIMYAKYTKGIGWSNATVISDGYNGVWGGNSGLSYFPSIAINKVGIVYIVWSDGTDGKWGDDSEIVYVNIQLPPTYYPPGGGDDDNDDDDDNEGEIIYGYDILIIAVASLSVSAIYLKKKYKKHPM